MPDQIQQPPLGRGGEDDAAPKLDRARVAGLLRQRGITATPQRIEIAAILLARSQHLSAEQLLKLVNEGELAVSKATVYNTLGLFARHGLVREVIVDPTKIFYDSNTSEHYHFYDVTTGRLTDIERSRITLGGLPELPEGGVVEGVDVVVRVRTRGG